MKAVWDALFGGKFPFIDDENGVTWDRSPRGYAARVKVVKRGGGGSGFRWAVPRTYDSSKSYQVGEEVIVNPSNAAVTTGIDGYFAAPGHWRLINPLPSDNPPAVMPIWPPIGYLTEQSALNEPDSETIYWWPINLFCVEEEEEEEP